MKLYEIQCAIWDRVHYYSAPGADYRVGDYVVVKNEQNLDFVKVIGIQEVKEDAIREVEEVGVIQRRATEEEIKKMEQTQTSKQKDIDLCQKLIEENQLAMKVIDVYYSLDGGKITFAFAAEGRVDFRSLLRDLTARYHKSIRLQQLGVRDVARAWGDIGICGRRQCCKSNLKKLSNINTEMADLQQVSHRGSDRLSGACGRYKCCLAYELDLYKEKVGKMPPIGSVVMNRHREKGEVVGWQVLKDAVEVKFDSGERAQELPLKDLKVIKIHKVESGS